MDTFELRNVCFNLKKEIEGLIAKHSQNIGGEAGLVVNVTTTEISVTGSAKVLTYKVETWAQVTPQL